MARTAQAKITTKAVFVADVSNQGHTTTWVRQPYNVQTRDYSDGRGVLSYQELVLGNRFMNDRGSLETREAYDEVQLLNSRPNYSRIGVRKG